MKRTWKIRAAAALACLCLLSGAVWTYAAQGDQNDPLVTLSYLTDVLTPAFLTQADAKIAAREAAYLEKLEQLSKDYVAKVEMAAGGVGTGGSGAAVFSVVELAAGQRLTGAVGCEVMLRVGSATLTSPESPGLVDSTDATVLENGGALVKNHLYLFTVEGRSIQAAGTVKVLVRGSYTVS